MPIKTNAKSFKSSFLKPAITAQESTIRSMRSNKSKDTKPELKLRKALWQAGLRGYRVHWAKAPGKPDVCFPTKRLAIFMNGCFWHRCPHCKPLHPKSNVAFWQEKFEKNQQRDARYKQLYREAGWQQLVVWECQLKEHVAVVIDLVKQLHQGVPSSYGFAA